MMKGTGVKVFLVMLCILLVTFSGMVGGFIVMFQTRQQARENQEHIDCVVSVLVRSEAPICAEVKAQLQREGIYPGLSGR